jgi:hypothetical protein
MKILIEMVPDHYDGLLEGCHGFQDAFSILKNGVVLHCQTSGKDQRSIAILCDEAQANRLLELAARLYPAAAADIARGVPFEREL